MSNLPHEILTTAYADHIIDIDSECIIWHDGTRMRVNETMGGEIIPIPRIEERDMAARLADPTLLDQIAMPYQRGSHGGVSDAGRLRFEPFFTKMYGATEHEVRAHLVEIPWIGSVIYDTSYSSPGCKDNMIPASRVNRVDSRMASVIRELSDFSAEFSEYFSGAGGTYTSKLVAGTNRRSAHNFGIAIDIGIAVSNYWLWDFKHAKGLTRDQEHVVENAIGLADVPRFRNRIPLEIIAVFEDHGFIWGGHWLHYDTMHFEYRPELLRPLKSLP